MSYNAKETSKFSGNPIYLYRFSRGGVSYDFCSLPEDLVVSGAISGTFAGSSVVHGKITIGQSPSRDPLDIVFPLGDAFARLFLKKHTRLLPTSVTIWRRHLDDPDEELRVVYKGKVRSGRPLDQTRIALSCSSLLSSVKLPGLGGFIHYPCHHALYFGGCRLLKSNFEVAGTVTALTDDVATVSEAALQADGHYSGGILEYDSTQVLITLHEGNQLTLRAIPDNLSSQITSAGSAAVTIAPGCDRSIFTCRDKFNNVKNFGGFPFLPEDDPWNDGSIV